MNDDELYDPPPSYRGGGQPRGRSSSFSSAPLPRTPLRLSSRRQSFSAASSRGPLEQSANKDRFDLSPPPPGISLAGPTKQATIAASEDRALWRDGRQSKQQMLEDQPKVKMTGDFESFMAQLFDLTHAIDAVENDVDEIVALRNKIVSLDPKVDVGSISLRAELDALSALTTQTGRGIVAIEDWLWSLYTWSKKVRDLVKSGQTGETLEEVAEIKYHIASAKMDFANAMERIREGAQQEAFRRERTRIWMARHIRHREPDIADRDVCGLLKAAELGAADGIAECHVASYAGLFALQRTPDPFTELAELTKGMAFLGDDLDDEIVKTATGKTQAKKIINLDRNASGHVSGPTRLATSKSYSKGAPPQMWYGSRYGFMSKTRPGSSREQSKEEQPDEYTRKFNYIQAEQFATEKDLEYGFARQAQLDRLNKRKKMVIVLLLFVIFALILFIVLATMRIPEDRYPSFQAKPSASSGGSAEAVAASLASIQATSDGKLPILSISEISGGQSLSLHANASGTTGSSAAQPAVGSALSAIASAAASMSVGQVSLAASALTTSLAGKAADSLQESIVVTRTTDRTQQGSGITTALLEPIPHTQSATLNSPLVQTSTFHWAPIAE